MYCDSPALKRFPDEQDRESVFYLTSMVKRDLQTQHCSVVCFIRTGRRTGVEKKEDYFQVKIPQKRLKR